MSRNWTTPAAAVADVFPSKDAADVFPSENNMAQVTDSLVETAVLLPTSKNLKTG
jgi:hypothetical protein